MLTLTLRLCLFTQTTPHRSQIALVCMFRLWLANDSAFLNPRLQTSNELITYHIKIYLNQTLIDIINPAFKYTL